MEIIWSLFGRTEADLFAKEDLTLCPLWFSWKKENSPLGLVHDGEGSLFYAFPPLPLILPTIQRVLQQGHRPPFGRRGSGFLCCIDSAAARHGAPLTGGISCHSWVVTFGIPTLVTFSCGLVFAGSNSQLRDYPETVRSIIMNARAQYTCLLIKNRWRLFSKWCVDRNKDPVHTILELLQSLLDNGQSHPTLKVYMGAISSQHVSVNNLSLGNHKLVSLLLKEALRLSEGYGVGPFLVLPCALMPCVCLTLSHCLRWDWSGCPWRQLFSWPWPLLSILENCMLY